MRALKQSSTYSRFLRAIYSLYSLFGHMYQLAQYGRCQHIAGWIEKCGVSKVRPKKDRVDLRTHYASISVKYAVYSEIIYKTLVYWILFIGWSDPRTTTDH